MSSQPTSDERLLGFLAECDEAIAAGRDLPTAPPELAGDHERVDRALGIMKMLRRVEQSPSVPDHPTFISRFRIDGELGRGGMSIVYNAWDADLGRWVALKVLQNSDPTQQARLLNEAGSLARLSHPNIVQVFEVGQHEGQPYLAMERIDGPTLQVGPEHGPLSPRAAAELLAPVARAIQHAHDHGIIHRDIKPGNILRTADGTPRVTDFGLARLTDRSSELTRTGAVLGTPSYMAPEQAGGLDQATRAIDIYGLGATLYALLTGRPPFLGLTVYDILQQVLHEEPLSLVRLNPAIPADLDTICRKCLEKDPARRYLSADALARDLERYLQGRPVHARPVSSLEKVRRWCGRNPVLTSLTAGLFLVLLVGITATSLLAAWAIRERNQAQLDRNTAITAQLEATDQAEIATTVRDFLQRDLLLQAAPGQQIRRGYKPQNDLTVKQALDRAAPLIPRRFAQRPRLEAALELTVGAAYTDLGYSALGIPHLHRSLELLRSILKPDHPDLIEPLQMLGMAQRMHAIPLAEQMPTQRELYRILRTVRGEPHPATLETAHSLAVCEIHAGDRALGIQMLRDLVETAKLSLGELAPITLHLHLTLALKQAEGLVPADEPEGVDALVRLNLAEQPLLYEPEQRFLLDFIFETFLQKARLDRAQHLLEGCLAEHRRRGSTDAEMLDVLTSHAGLLRIYNHPRQAGDVYDAVRKGWMARKDTPKSHIHSLEEVLLECRLLAGADENLEPMTRALVEARQPPQKQPAELGKALVLRGWCLHKLKHHLEAQICLELGWDTIPADGTDAHLRAWGRSLFGQVLLANGLRADAEKHLTEAHQMLGKLPENALHRHYQEQTHQVLQHLRKAPVKPEGAPRP